MYSYIKYGIFGQKTLDKELNKIDGYKKFEKNLNDMLKN